MVLRLLAPAFFRVASEPSHLAASLRVQVSGSCMVLAAASQDIKAYLATSFDRPVQDITFSAITTFIEELNQAALDKALAAIKVHHVVLHANSAVMIPTGLIT